MRTRYLIVAALSLLFASLVLQPSRSFADTPPDALRIGFIGSLSSFAANYGTAVLEGAKLAVSELEQQGHKIELFVEDDQSVPKNAVSAYAKLTGVDKVKAIIGGTWWANSFVQHADRDGIPLLSCETLFNGDSVSGKTSFILHGDLRNWITVYEPLVRARGWKRAAVVHFTSGFGGTIAAEMKAMFSKEGRKLVSDIEYNSIEMADAPSIVLELKKMKPDVVYVDAQPGGLANLLKKLNETGEVNLPVLSNSIMENIARDKILDLAPFPNLYFTKRANFDPDFAKRFKAKYGKEPYLEADLGYNAVFLLNDALRSATAVERLKSGLLVNGKSYKFDEHNVDVGIPQEVYAVKGNEFIRWTE